MADATSFDRDEYAIGLRGDYKRKLKGLARIFVGVFVEGPLAALRSLERIGVAVKLATFVKRGHGRLID